MMIVIQHRDTCFVNCIDFTDICLIYEKQTIENSSNNGFD